MNFYKKAVAAATPETATKPFSKVDKLAYAAGDFGCNMSFALSSYLMLFWTQYMGISLGVWAIIILLLKIWDAINDPIIGILIDAIKPKPGQSKFKPWIFWGSFALIISGALCFIPVQTAPMWLKITICVLGYLLWDMSYTIVNVPYGSLNSVISSSSTERASLSTWRSIGAFLATVILTIAIPIFIFDKENHLLGGSLIFIGLIAGVIGLFCFQFLIRGTTERVIVDYSEQKEKVKINYFKSIKSFFTNRAAVSFTIATILQLLVFGFAQTLTSLYIQQTFPGLAKISGVAGFLGFLPMLFLIPFITKAVNKYGKKECSGWPMLLGVVAGIILLVTPIEQIQNQTVGFIVWMIPSLLMGLAMGANQLVCWAMVADCIDYQEVRTGVREEGVVYATYSLGRKFAQGISASLVSVLLIITGYNAELGPNQAVGVNSNIRLLLGAVFLICFVGQFVLFTFIYNLSKKKVEEIEQQLGRTNSVDINESLTNKD